MYFFLRFCFQSKDLDLQCELYRAVLNVEKNLFHKTDPLSVCVSACLIFGIYYSSGSSRGRYPVVLHVGGRFMDFRGGRA